MTFFLSLVWSMRAVLYFCTLTIVGNNLMSNRPQNSYLLFDWVIYFEALM